MKSPIALRLIVSGLLAVSVTSCSFGEVDAAPAAEVVRVSGSGTAAPIVERLAEEFAADHPWVTFEFGVGTNTGGGVIGVSEGTLDLGVANRPLKDEERTYRVGYHPFALDAMVFAVNLPNEVSNLSSAQVRAIYSGDITDWSGIDGGGSAPVVLLGRDPNESATRLLLDPFMDGVDVSESVIILERSSEMLDALRSTPGAIGFTSLGLLRLKDITTVAPLTLDAIEPGPSTLSDGSYPWVMTFALVSPPGGATNAAADFLRFVTSDEARAILEEFGYAPPSA